MISSLASVVGLHANETRTALEGRWSDRRFMYALYTLTALLPGRAKEAVYEQAEAAWRRQQRSNAANMKRHVHVPSDAVNGDGRL
jgi:hypothetical protein